MKKIGIILRDYKSLSNNDLSAIRSDLVTFLRKYNIETICIPVCLSNNEFDEFKRVVKGIKECSGIILPGGQNYHEIDLKIAKFLYDKNIPTLGICLGMQIMALTFNGNINYLKNNNHQSKEEYVHKIKIKEDSKLHNILKTNELIVNSRHSEHITTTDLQITALANDLTIEAIEDSKKTFFIGVQWHPESIINDLYSKRLFDHFIDIIERTN